MLNRIGYLTDDYTQSKVFFETVGKGDFVLVMTPEQFSLMKEVILKAHTIKRLDAETTFTLCFDFSNTIALPDNGADLYVEDFIQFSFLPAIQTSLSAVVFYFIPPILEVAAAAWLRFSSALNKAFARQGFPDILFKPVHLSKIHSGVLMTDFHTTHVHLPEGSLQESYYQVLMKKGVVGGALFVIKKSVATFENIVAVVLNTEKKFGEAEAVIYNLMNENLALHTKVEKLESLYEATFKDLNNQKAYLTIYQSKSESLGINEFYYYEYEVLPLWYKRLGHIIKVVTGRRTFQSLYDKNAKKYLN